MKKHFFTIILIIILVFVGNGVLRTMQIDNAYKSQSLTEFMRTLESDRASKIEYVHNYESEGILRYKIEDEMYAVKYPGLYLSFNADIINKLAEHEIDLEFRSSPLGMLRAIGSGSVSLIILVLLVFLVRYMMSTVSEEIYVTRSEKEKTTFTDIAGYKHVKEELKDFVEMLKNPSSYSRYHVDVPKGILLKGPPGTGKTLCARAIAGESNTPFFHISAAQIENKWVGSGSRRLEKVIRDVKKMSKKHGRAILFIDEIDAIGIMREKRTVVESNQTLNTLLTAMDGFEKDNHILFIAATNLADKLDPALIRAGRFDKSITIPHPNYKDRQEIFELYLHQKRDIIDPEVYEKDFLHILATQTNGKCGADIKQIVNEACSIAHRNEKNTVDIECLREALIKTTVGLEWERKENEEEQRIIAYHEAGHVTMRCLLHPKGAQSIAYVTIRSYSNALGHVSPIEEDKTLMRKSELENNVKMLLAGRIVEERILNGDYTSGAASDLQQVNRLLYTFVTKYGMAEDVKNLFVENVDEKDEYVRESINKIRSELYKQAQTLIDEHYEFVEKIANHLLEHRFMDQESIMKAWEEYKKGKLSS